MHAQLYLLQKMLYNNLMCTLLPDEKIEDLGCKGMRLIQSRNGYRFTTDAVLLANFCKDMSGKICVEFCAGSGVISILLAAKKQPKHIYAVELQPRLAEMATRSVRLNGLQGVISVVNADIKNKADYLNGQLVDVVVCNPPYRRVGSGETQQQTELAICRHEICACLSDIIKAAATVLNNRGSFYLVHQSSRLAEICTLCAQYKLAVKEILPVCPRPERAPNLVLVRAVKGGAADCVLHAPMFVTDADGVYTTQAKAWYGIEG